MTREWLAAVGCRWSRASVDRIFRRTNVVVDGLGNAHQIDAALERQTAQDAQAAVAADSDQGIDLELRQTLEDAVTEVDPVAIRLLVVEGVTLVGGAEDGAGPAQDLAGEARESEHLGGDRTRQQAVGAVPNADDLPAVAQHRAFDHGPDHRVKSGAIAAAGQESDPLRFRHGLPLTLFRGRQSRAKPRPVQPPPEDSPPAPETARLGIPVGRADSGVFWYTASMEEREIELIRERLSQLKSEHRDLDDVIARISEEAPFDQIQVKRLKKRKLMLKDQILQLESRLLPDIIA